MEILKRVVPSLPSPPSSVTKKKSRLSYSITFKLAAVRHAEVHGNRATARYLGINEKQIRDWRSKKLSLMNTNANAKRLKGAGRQVNDTKREKELKTWLDREQEDGKCISQGQVQEKAKSLSSDERFKASSGWWRRWKIRHSYMLSKPTINIAINNNNNYMNTMHSSYDTYLPPSLPLSRNKITPSHFPVGLPSYKYQVDHEKEFKDRITCALALLELKANSPTNHTGHTH